VKYAAELGLGAYSAPRRSRGVRRRPGVTVDGVMYGLRLCRVLFADAVPLPRNATACAFRPEVSDRHVCFPFRDSMPAGVFQVRLLYRHRRRCARRARCARRCGRAVRATNLQASLMLSSVLGNLCLGLAAVLAALLFALAPQQDGGASGGGKLMLVVLLGLPFALSLAGALEAAVVRGGLDWLSRSRGLQHGFALALALCVTVVTVFCVALYREPPAQMPWTLRPLIGVALYLLPLLVLAGTALALNAAWRAALPAALVRAPLLLAGAGAALICAGLLVELLVAMQADSVRRIEERQAADAERDREMLAEVASLDPLTQLGRLLNQTSRYETPAIRELALRKVRSNPALNDELARMLRNEWRGEALTFLAWNDAPDAAALAAPLRDGIVLLAEDVRREMRDAHYLHDDEFDPLAERVLAAVDRVGSHGVDYVSAVRTFRAALDEPRTQTIAPRCRARLDAWLADRR